MDLHLVRKSRQKRVNVNFIVNLRHIWHIFWRSKRSHDRSHIHRTLRDLHGIIGKHILFRLFYVVVETVGERKHKAYADNADTSADRS